MEPQVGTILEGKVTTITKFGAFIALEGGKSGLVHISEIANTYVNDVRDFVQEGQEVKVKVLASENGKLNLSIKKALPQNEYTAAPRSPRAPQGQPSRPVQNADRGNGRFAPRTPQPAQPVTPEQAFEKALLAILFLRGDRRLHRH